MEQTETDENRFIDLAFLTSKKSYNWNINKESSEKKKVNPEYSDKLIVDSRLALSPTFSRRERGLLPSGTGRRAGNEDETGTLTSIIERIPKQPIYNPKKAGLTMPMTHLNPSQRRDTQVRVASLKSEIEIEFGEKQLRNPGIVHIRTQIQTIQKERGIKIFVFRSNRPTREQTDCTTKIAELLAGQEKTKILLINGLCQTRKTGTGIIPIYQVIRKSDIVNLYFMSLEGFFTESDPGQQKRMQELMQLFEISFNYILINQLVRQSLAVETFLGQSPVQRFKLLFPGSHPHLTHH